VLIVIPITTPVKKNFADAAEKNYINKFARGVIPN